MGVCILFLLSPARMYAAPVRLIRGHTLLRLIGFAHADDDEPRDVCTKLAGNAFSAFGFSAVAIGALIAYGASVRRD